MVTVVVMMMMDRCCCGSVGLSTRHRLLLVSCGTHHAQISEAKCTPKQHRHCAARIATSVPAAPYPFSFSMGHAGGACCRYRLCVMGCLWRTDIYIKQYYMYVNLFSTKDMATYLFIYVISHQG